MPTDKKTPAKKAPAKKGGPLTMEAILIEVKALHDRGWKLKKRKGE
jgi:hypothetical protein